ncbi:hypothetical protein PAHAL_2G043500 [Panicum hallii]|uniref:Uncharacterized protein n=1 Tax=Panicum hallii TaxID=206008 RepID=A0A2S3GVV9_9POAL|nr:hypothetical protein PAHAL_2G043500 [Panicum hallii]
MQARWSAGTRRRGHPVHRHAARPRRRGVPAPPCSMLIPGVDAGGPWRAPPRSFALLFISKILLKSCFHKRRSGGAPPLRPSLPTHGGMVRASPAGIFISASFPATGYMATAGVAVNSPFPQIHQDSGSPWRHGVFIHASSLEVGPCGGGLFPSSTATSSLALSPCPR